MPLHCPLILKTTELKIQFVCYKVHYAKDCTKTDSESVKLLKSFLRFIGLIFHTFLSLIFFLSKSTKMVGL